MDDILVAKRVGPNRTICLSTLSRNQLADSPEYSGDHFGYFIYEVDHSRATGGVTVLARVVSFEAALRILQIAERGFAVTSDELETA